MYTVLVYSFNSFVFYKNYFKYIAYHMEEKMYVIKDLEYLNETWMAMLKNQVY